MLNSVNGDVLDCRTCVCDGGSEIWLRREPIAFTVSKATPETVLVANGGEKPRSRSTWRDQGALFMQRASLHGLADIYRSRNQFVRVTWIVLFVGALGAAIYGCCAIIRTYYAAPIVASYFIKGMPSRFPLPDFVICPFNRFSSQFLRQNNVSDEVSQYMQLSFGAVTHHPYQRRALKQFLHTVELTKLNDAMSATLTRLNMTFSDFLDAASLKCEDFLIDCTMPNGIYRCCDNATDIMTFTGKCFRIPAADQSGVGYGYGASLVIALPKPLYSLSLNNWLNDGVVLQLAEPGRAVDYSLTFLSAGTHALMPLKATRFEFIDDPPHFECVKDAEANYSILDCFEGCVTEDAENACQCTVVTKWKQRTTFPACTTAQFYNCIVGHMQITLGTDELREKYFYNCRQRCKPRCQYWQYQSSISYANFPLSEARPFARTQLEWKRMQSAIILDVYFEKLEYTLIRHHRAMTIHGIIANLGGQCSLWLGGSILTLVQLFVFAMRYLIAIFKARKCRKSPCR